MSKESDNSETISQEKLLIDNPSDFQFHAAYVTYSEAYDKTMDLETKKHLNQNIAGLQQNQIDYITFYRNISQYRSKEASQYHYDRTTIRSQKKREWRRETQRQERNKRHKR